MQQKISIISSALSRYDNYCDGYTNTGNVTDGYILCAFQGIGKAEIKLNHNGSIMLDEINAFDVAETDGAYIGQINMITVSSFCGPQGLILGYDFLKPHNLHSCPTRESFPKFVINKMDGRKIPIFSNKPLINATATLFGDVNKKNFPIMPGAHVPCAGKNIKAKGPARVYSGLAIGIAEDRQRQACLLMEDVGTIPTDLENHALVAYEDKIIGKLAESILEVGKNQHVDYKEIFVGVKSIYVKSGEIACALVACPYITLARNAILKKADGSLDFNATSRASLNTWSKIKKNAQFVPSNNSNNCST